MDLRHLRALLAFHRRGTIAAAADDVHLSPAAVSVQLKLLEESLGLALFLRTGRSIRLTAAGYQLLPQAEKLLRAYDDLRKISVQDAIQGVISIGIMQTALVGIFPAVLQRIMAEHPQVQVKVTVGTSPDLVSKILAGVLDAVIVNRPPTPLDDDFIVHTLYTEPLALVKNSNSPGTTLSDCLHRQPYIALDRGTWTGRKIEEVLSSRGIHLEPSLELDSQEAILAAVRYGLGASVLPIIREAKYGTDPQLHFTKIGDTHRAIALVERKIHVLSPMTAQILSIIATVVQEGED